MTPTLLPSWLPQLVLLEEHGGDWTRYLAAIYAVFTQDFISDLPAYNGVKLALKRHPVIQGKEATFWHIISDGGIEEDRLPDMRRCERIRWPRPVIERSGEESIKVWNNERRGEKRICLWLENAEYLVILAERNGYIMLWTAYTVDQEHRKRKLQREYAASIKS